MQNSHGATTWPPLEGASGKASKKSKRSKNRLPLPENPPESGHAILARSSRSRRADATDERDQTKGDGTSSSSVWSNGSDTKDGRFHSPISNGVPHVMQSGQNQLMPDVGEKSHVRHEKERQHMDDTRRRRRQHGRDQREHEKHRASAALDEGSSEQPGQSARRTRSKKIKPPAFPPGTYTPKVSQGGLELSSF